MANNVQVQAPARQGGRKRKPHAKEVMALLIAALGAANQWTGVLWKNGQDSNGEPIAIVLMRRARFEEDETGMTTLIEVEQECS